MEIMPPAIYTSFKYLLALGLLIYYANAMAQANLVSGTVVGGNLRLSGAEISNSETGQRTNSDEKGAFSIKAKKGDTLITTMFHYKADTLLITNQGFVMVRLKPASKILNEVTIKGTAISPLEKYNQNKLEYKEIYRIGDKSKMIAISVGTIPGITINIDKLYSALSKEGKDARRLQRTLTRDYEGEVVDQHYTKTLVAPITGYLGKQLDNFMIAHRPSYEFVVKATDYEMIEYVKKAFALELKMPPARDSITLVSPQTQ